MFLLRGEKTLQHEKKFVERFLVLESFRSKFFVLAWEEELCSILFRVICIHYTFQLFSQQLVRQRKTKAKQTEITTPRWSKNSWRTWSVRKTKLSFSPTSQHSWGWNSMEKISMRGKLRRTFSWLNWLTLDEIKFKWQCFQFNSDWEFRVVLLVLLKVH